MDETTKKTFDQTLALREVDGAEIISLVDNSVDFLSTIEREGVQQVRKWIGERRDEVWIKENFRLPMAEHGFSMFVRVFCDGNTHSILLDTGGSPEGVVTNANRMGLNLSEIQSIVLSHGHYDHFGGLLTVLKAVKKEDLPIIVHEDMFKTRGVVDANGVVRKHPDFPIDDKIMPAKYVRTKQPYLLSDNTVLITGEIPRRTEFEKGFPQHRVFVDGKWQPDPWIWDDRAIVINIEKKGLVVISGCAHAGIVNTILCAQQATGITPIHAILGGFHLAGKDFEPRIPQTVERLKRLNPTILAPSHCTGWRGIYALSREMPGSFVWNSVGNLYHF